jgi:hypothetical protein
MLGIFLGCAVILFSASPATAQSASSVANKTFTTWTSQSFSAPPFAPFQDCYRFTATTVDIDGCPGTGRLLEIPLFGSPILSLWIGSGMCLDNGLNLTAVGTSIDGSAFGAVDAMGGFLLESVNVATFGIEGMFDPGCVLPSSAPATNPYRAH